MRYTPVSLALSLLVALTASAGQSAAPEVLVPAAAALQAEARAALAAGDTERAYDGFEAALAIHPGSARLMMDLADTARAQGMQGKALHYYRAVLERDPANTDAIAGEGAALVEKGALEKARRNLTRLQSVCGDTCAPTRALAAAISAAEAKPKMVSAEVAVKTGQN